MHFKHLPWTTKKLYDIRNDIDPKPQYQRGDAWDDKKRSLLIDSILSNFDIPKIYLRYTKNIGTFDYEVADGQQRLKAIWRFLDDKLPLQGMSDANSNLEGLTFSELSETEKNQVRDYEFVTTVVYNATNDEIRELFRRLQLGVRLNPAEIRNSIASALGNAIAAMAVTHSFFKHSPFSTARYKSDDLLAHAFAIVIYERSRDIKAPDLKKMYFEFAKKIDTGITRKVNEILSFLDNMQQSERDCIKTKWGFVDLVGVVAKRNLTRLSARAVATSYVQWESERLTKMSDLPALAQARVGSRARKLYDYVSAFQKEGATKANLQKRFDILNSVLQ
jgi:Protein of unknown function DUF262